MFRGLYLRVQAQYTSTSTAACSLSFTTSSNFRSFVSGSFNFADPSGTQTRQLRRRGQEPERWHWAYTGRCFRLDPRSKTAGGRPLISPRGFVATRESIDGLREQLHAEALRRGLGQAAGVLVIGDGALWIWRLADDRFKDARQRLDFYHAVQHLAAVGRALFGENQAKLKEWLRPLVRQLKNESAIKVVEQLEEIPAQLPSGAAAQAVQKEVNYFHEHQDRRGYRTGRRRGEPIGSGAVESTCRQNQCRFSGQANIGVRLEMRRCFAWKLFGATVDGTCSFLTIAVSTLPKTEMRPLDRQESYHQGAQDGFGGLAVLSTSYRLRINSRSAAGGARARCWGGCANGGHSHPAASRDGSRSVRGSARTPPPPMTIHL